MVSWFISGNIDSPIMRPVTLVKWIFPNSFQETFMEKFVPHFAEWGLDTSQQATSEDIAAEKEAPKTVLPCLIVMCGSGVGCFKVNRAQFQCKDRLIRHGNSIIKRLWDRLFLSLESLCWKHGVFILQRSPELRHDLETLSASLALCEGNPLISGAYLFYVHMNIIPNCCMDYLMFLPLSHVNWTWKSFDCHAFISWSSKFLFAKFLTPIWYITIA